MDGSADIANMKDEEPRHLAGTKRRGSEAAAAAPTFEVCNGMDNHGHVRNPKELIQEANNRLRHDNRLLYYNDVVLEWITNHVLASVIFFDVALIVPLLTLNASNTVKITLGVISSSWIQWWALPALQRSQNKTQAQNEAKAEVDHQTLTYLAKLQDEQVTELKSIADILRNLKNT
jgi:hypothetical protein